MKQSCLNCYLCKCSLSKGIYCKANKWNGVILPMYRIMYDRNGKRRKYQAGRNGYKMHYMFNLAQTCLQYDPWGLE